MKKYILFLLPLFVLSSCSVDLMDENTSKVDNSVPGSITVDVMVGSEMVSTRSAVSDDEKKVESYSVYVFDVITGFLQYKKENIAPTISEPVEGKRQVKIGEQKIELPNSGSKNIYVLANQGDALMLPVMITITEDPSNPTSLSEFKSSTRLQYSSAPVAPFAMTGGIYVATSVDIRVPVVLGRSVLKIQARSKDERVRVKTLQARNCTKTYFPFVQTDKYAGTVDYASMTAADGETVGVMYMLPAPGNSVVVVAEVTVGSSDVTLETIFPDELYSDYDYKLDYSMNAKGELVATISPSSGSGSRMDPVEFSGEWMTGTKELTLPYASEPNYGFMIDYVLNVKGTPSVKINDGADWYDVSIVSDSKLRVRTIKENTQKERTSSFTFSCSESEKVTVTVKQQGTQDIKSVIFNGLEWMDRNVGAVYRANQVNCTNVLAYGYMYQWGRNTAFPPCGEVKVSQSQMSPDQAAASSDFISYLEGTNDWNSNGVAGNTLSTWDSVSGNPCPEGWRLPTYAEIEEILPYRLNSLIFASGKQSRENARPDRSEKMLYLGYGSGAISEYKAVNAIYGIMNNGKDDAYYIRWMISNEGGVVTSDPNNGGVNYISGGTNVLRISRIKADATATYASQKAAIEFWDANSPEEDIYFPSAGRRDSSGNLQELGNAVLYWTGSMYSNPKSSSSDKYCSGMFYFRPAGKYMIMPVPAFGSAQVYYDTEEYARRTQAMPIRCVKVKQ